MKVGPIARVVQYLLLLGWEVFNYASTRGPLAILLNMDLGLELFAVVVVATDIAYIWRMAIEDPPLTKGNLLTVIKKEDTRIAYYTVTGLDMFMTVLYVSLLTKPESALPPGFLWAPIAVPWVVGIIGWFVQHNLLKWIITSSVSRGSAAITPSKTASFSRK